MMVSARGIALLTTNGEPVYDLPESFTMLGVVMCSAKFPLTAIIWVALTIIAIIVLKYRTF